LSPALEFVSIVANKVSTASSEAGATENRNTAIGHGSGVSRARSLASRGDIARQTTSSCADESLGSLGRSDSGKNVAGVASVCGLITGKNGRQSTTGNDDVTVHESGVKRLARLDALGQQRPRTVGVGRESCDPAVQDKTRFAGKSGRAGKGGVTDNSRSRENGGRVAVANALGGIGVNAIEVSADNGVTEKTVSRLA